MEQNIDAAMPVIYEPEYFSCIATSPWANDRGIGVRFFAETRHSLFYTTFTPYLRPTQLLFNGGSFAGSKAAGAWSYVITELYPERG
jgi:hypothetical protein